MLHHRDPADVELARERTDTDARRILDDVQDAPPALVTECLEQGIRVTFI
jgi:hypothetical protein